MTGTIARLGFAAILCAWTAQEDLSWIDKKIAELQPRASEKKFDEIGWVRELREAERLAKENGRGVFLFTHDGRMATGRC